MSTSRRALVLPGRAYLATMPLLHLTGLALAQHGWPVRAVSWELPGDAVRSAEIHAEVARAVDAFLAAPHL